MHALLRQRAVIRALVTALLAISVMALPGAATAAPNPLPAYRVLPGTVLHPVPPAAVLPVTRYHLTGRFGDRSGLWASAHTGLDFAAPSGSRILSVDAGVVTASGYDGSYGMRTVLRLVDGTTLWYCHQSTVDVRVGQHVRAGQVIGTVGSTGNVTGPHLHLEVRPTRDEPVDPLTWLRRHGLRP
jgi:murein DD-endopeptidase MepM/ murein hydrolase activator NlpD